MTRTAVVVGNPRPGSRTLAAAELVARRLTDRAPDTVVDLATVGAGLLDWSDPVVADLVDEVGDADLVVVASPTYKGTYTGLLKLFLDRFPVGRIRGVVVPLMLGGGPTHALAPGLTLRPLLDELGATTVRAHYVVDSAYDDPSSYDAWLEAVAPIVHALARRPEEVAS